MDFPIHIDTISMGLPILYFKGSQVEISNYDVRGTGRNFQLCCISVPEGCFNLFSNSAGPGEMQHNAAFHLGLHSLQEYLFRGFQYTKALRVNEYLKVFLQLNISLITLQPMNLFAQTLC